MIADSSVLFRCECGCEGSVAECKYDSVAERPVCPNCGKVDPGYEDIDKWLVKTHSERMAEIQRYVLKCNNYVVKRVNLQEVDGE